jgi:hypothetical protein
MIDRRSLSCFQSFLRKTTCLSTDIVKTLDRREQPRYYASKIAQKLHARERETAVVLVVVVSPNVELLMYCLSPHHTNGIYMPSSFPSNADISFQSLRTRERFGQSRFLRSLLFPFLALQVFLELFETWEAKVVARWK